MQSLRSHFSKRFYISDRLLLVPTEKFWSPIIIVQFEVLLFCSRDWGLKYIVGIQLTNECWLKLDVVVLGLLSATFTIFTVPRLLVNLSSLL